MHSIRASSQNVRADLGRHEISFPFKYNWGVSLSMPVPSLSWAISSVLLVYLNIMNGLESLDYNQHQIDTCKYESIKMLPWMMRTNEVGGGIRHCRRHSVIFDLASWKYCSTILPDLIRVVPTMIPIFLMPPTKLKWQIWSTIWIHQCVSRCIDLDDWSRNCNLLLPSSVQYTCMHLNKFFTAQAANVHKRQDRRAT